MESELCSLKNVGSTKCYGPIKPRSELSEEDVQRLYRTTSLKRIGNICSNHLKDYLHLYPYHQKKCCDPFRVHTKSVTKNITEISLEWALKYEHFKPVIPGQKICFKCKKQVETECVQSSTGSSSSSHTPQASTSISEPLFSEQTSSRHEQPSKPEASSRQLSEVSEESQSSESQEDSQSFCTPPDEALKALNASLTAVGNSPIESRKSLRSAVFRSDKLDKFQTAVTDKMGKAAKGYVQSPLVPKNQDACDFQEVLSQLKEAYLKHKNNKRKQLQVLSVLPATWTISQTCQVFGCSRYFVRLAKNITKELGILPDISPRTRKRLSQELVDHVYDFYYESDNSRELPGIKDCISVRKADGTRETKQKRLVLSNLKELHKAFLTANRNIKLSFSKFCELRPKECVLAGAAGTHSVCVCLYHQNFKLLVDAADIIDYDPEGQEIKLSYKDVLQMVICDPSTDNCYLGQCDLCPGTDKLIEILEINFDLHEQQNVKYRQWTKTDRSELITFEVQSSEFIKKLEGQIPSVLEHDLVTKKQSKFLKKTKEELKEGEIIVIGDFSENYSIVWQDAVQGVHWSDIQVTLHPFIIYYRKNGELEVLSFVVVSDSKSHTWETVYAFQHALISFLKEKLGDIKQIFYFTDGAAHQYKNRKMVFCLRLHFLQFGIWAQWHFFATSHGKGPCDGLAGSLKRHAARESLQRTTGEGITSPKLFYEWAKKKFEDTVKIVFVGAEKITSVSQEYLKTLHEAPEVTNIQSSHAVVPLSQNVVLLKQYSEADVGIYYYFGPPDEVVFEDLHGFIVIQHDCSWRLGLVHNRRNRDQKIQVMLLIEDSTNQKLKYSFPTEDQRQLVVKNVNDVLAICNVEPIDATSVKINRNTKLLAETKMAQRVSTLSSTSQESQRKKRKTR